MLSLLLLTIDNEQDRSKLEQLYLTYHRSLYFTAYDILKDHHAAEDAVQTSMVKISKHLDKIYEIKCNKTYAYLVTIVRNYSKSEYNRCLKIDKRTDNDCDIAQIVDDFIIDQRLIRHEKSQVIAEQLSKIKASYADIISLKYYHDLSHSEIAQLLQISESNVRVQLYRAQKALAKVLKNKLEDLTD